MQDSVNCEKRDIADFNYSSLNSIDFDRLFTLNRRSAPQVRQRDHLDYMDEQG